MKPLSQAEPPKGGQPGCEAVCERSSCKCHVRVSCQQAPRPPCEVVSPLVQNTIVRKASCMTRDGTVMKEGQESERVQLPRREMPVVVT